MLTVLHRVEGNRLVAREAALSDEPLAPFLGRIHRYEVFVVNTQILCNLFLGDKFSTEENYCHYLRLLETCIFATGPANY